MRVCDRHPRTQARGRVLFELEDESFDLCEQCLYDIRTFIADVGRKEVEVKPKKSFLKDLVSAK